MSYAENPYQAPQYTFAAQAAENERADFIVKTYAHLAGGLRLSWPWRPLSSICRASTGWWGQ